MYAYVYVYPTPPPPPHTHTHTHRLVVQERVDRLARRLVLDPHHVLPELRAPLRDEDGEERVGRHGRQGDAFVVVVVGGGGGVCDGQSASQRDAFFCVCCCCCCCCCGCAGLGV